MPKLVEDAPFISVFTLYRAGALLRGQISRWEWAGRDVEIVAHGARATFAIDGHEVEVPITWHPGTLGGEWPSWQCPQCGKGAYLIYNNELVCWRCAGLFHATYARHRSPAPWQVKRLWRRLGDGPRPVRGGRAVVRYDRFARKIAAAECRMLVALDGVAAGLERKVKHERQQQRGQHADGE